MHSFLWLSNYNKLWKILKEMGIPDHLTCLLRNLHAGQEATVRTGHGTIDWFQIAKGVRQGCILSSCLFNLYAEYFMRNAGLEEIQEKKKDLQNQLQVIKKIAISSVQSLSCVQLFATPWIPAHQASLSITNSRSSFKLMSIESVMPSIQPSHPLLSPTSPAPHPSQHQSLFQ